ncbi:MAG: zf-HC2 domain-containing protein [Tumebacillaceae bacterium]
MTCNESFFMIQRHYDGELSVEEKVMLDRHLVTCTDCQQEYDEYGKLFGDISSLLGQVQHRDVLSQTLKRLDEAEKVRHRDRWWRGAAVAASLAVIGASSFFTLTDAGQDVRHRVSAVLHEEKAEEKTEQKPVTDVEHNPLSAMAAMEEIRRAVDFTLLELQDPRLVLDSTQMIGGDQTAMYQMVELEYAVQEGAGKNSDQLYVIATPDPLLKAKAKTYIGTYQFNGEITSGPFKWARVGAHAITAEINGVFYQIFSPFLTTEQLADIAQSLKRHG